MWAWVTPQACPASKRTPRTIVATSRMKKLRRLSCATASSAKWQVTPLESRIIGLKKGIGHQLTGTVFGGGQLNGCEPKREKYTANMLPKNITSETRKMYIRIIAGSRP